MREQPKERNLPLRLVAGVAAVMLAALVLFNLVMRPGAADFRLMASFLAVTSLVTLLVAFIAHRMGWLGRVPRLRWALFGTYAISSVLTFVNVWVTARLMFASEHDLLLATILLLFAGGIAMTLGYFFTETLAQRISRLNETARAIREQGLGARVEIDGADEIAQLGGSFNHMLAKLEEADRRQMELDALRRDLIAWVGHDLQTPLASIRAIVEALADGIVEDEETKARYLRTAKGDIQALSSLIDDLFELSQLDAGGLVLDRRPNSLSDLISDTLESFTALAAERGVQLSGDVRPGIGSVVMDANRIGRALNNLVSNAIRHTPTGGEVLLCARRENGRVTVEVNDNGEGLDPADLPHLFDRFYRGEKSRSRATGGVGLGLAIAKGFVEAHGGEIGAEGLPAGGARFTMKLPVG